MLVNCNIDGGCAFPDLQLACGTMGTPMPKAANIAAHEIAHAVARVCEQYIKLHRPRSDVRVSESRYRRGETGGHDSLGRDWLRLPSSMAITGSRAVHVLVTLSTSTMNR